MKTLTLSCILAVCALYTTCYGKMFRVNNTMATDKSQGLYASLKEAHDDAGVAPHDTLMIEGTAITHPDLELTKPLVLIGPGYLLTSNPGTQATVAQAIVSRIHIRAEAAGTVLIGLTFSNRYSTSAPYIEASHVIVMRCHFPNTVYLDGETQNVQILQNYFDGTTISNYYSTARFTDVVLKNNIISSNVNITSNVTYPRIFSVVENNIFRNGVTLTAGTFRNNVLATTGSNINVTSAETHYNLFRNAANVMSGTGNQAYAETDLFVGATGTSPDGQYKLKPNSPYLGAGSNGTQPGVFGGNYPYVLSGVPPLPAIYFIEADQVASQQTGLQVKIKAKSNP